MELRVVRPCARQNVPDAALCVTAGGLAGLLNSPSSPFHHHYPSLAPEVIDMTRGSVRFVIAAAVLLHQSACGDPTGTESELESARARWAAQAPAVYSYTLSRVCFCPVEWIGPVTVTVRNGVVESVKYTQTGGDVTPLARGNFPAVEGLFAAIDSARANRVARLDVAYDATLGYPTRIDVDVNLKTADEEYTYVASNLVAR